MANTKVQSEQIEDGSITADKLADGTIVAAELANNAVVTAAINADAVTGAKIADDAIDSEHYTDGSIDTAHIADAQITVAKMAANSVDSDQYVDGSIDTVHIADAQVTTAKIANGNISTAKIADNAVTSAKLDTNIDIAGTFDVTGATTLDSTLAVAGATTLAGDVDIDATDDLRLRFLNGGTFKGGIQVPTSSGDMISGSAVDDLAIRSQGNILFSSGGNTEHMRIASGNVLIGKNNDTFGNAGIALRGSVADFTRSGNVPININRLSDNGEQIKFHKDGTLTGSINTVDGAHLKIVGQGNLHFNQNGNSANRSINFTGTSFKPFDSSDNTLDLGTSGGRFKDLYLSGGAYIGGTAAANKLDDYEEGTWNVAVVGQLTQNNVGQYTKVGNACTVHFSFTCPDNSGSPTAALFIGGLPFACGYSGVGLLRIYNAKVSNTGVGGAPTFISGGHIWGDIGANSNGFYVRVNSTNSNPYYRADLTESGTVLGATFTYITNT